MSDVLGSCRRVNNTPWMFEERRRTPDRRKAARPAAVSSRYATQPWISAELTVDDDRSTPFLAIGLAVTVSAAVYWMLWQVGSVLLH